MLPGKRCASSRVPKTIALIERGLAENPSYTTEDVIAGLQSGYFQLFEEDQGIVVTKFSGFRDKRLLVFLLVGENFDEWKERIVARLKRFAKENGCSCIEAYCRPGLQKVLKPLGWELEQVVLRTRIE
jgi:hypothetical protein